MSESADFTKLEVLNDDSEIEVSHKAAMDAVTRHFKGIYLERHQALSMVKTYESIPEEHRDAIAQNGMYRCYLNDGDNFVMGNLSSLQFTLHNTVHGIVYFLRL